MPPRSTTTNSRERRLGSAPMIPMQDDSGIEQSPPNPAGAVESAGAIAGATAGATAGAGADGAGATTGATADGVEFAEDSQQKNSKKNKRYSVPADRFHLTIPPVMQVFSPKSLRRTVLRSCPKPNPKTSIEKTRQKQERRAAQVVVIILSAFIMCWAPFFLLNVIEPLMQAPVDNTVWWWAVWLGYVQSWAESGKSQGTEITIRKEPRGSFFALNILLFTC